jgi:hypothetical protein
VGTVAAPLGPPTGQTWRFYYYAPSASSGQAPGQRIAVRTHTAGNDKLQYLFTDQLGSTSVANNLDGSVVQRQSYYPWGQVRQAGGLPSDHQFTGAVADASAVSIGFSLTDYQASMVFGLRRQLQWTCISSQARARLLLATNGGRSADFRETLNE